MPISDDEFCYLYGPVSLTHLLVYPQSACILSMVLVNYFCTTETETRKHGHYQ